MKKLSFVFASLFMIAAIMSCSEDMTNDLTGNSDSLLKKAGGKNIQTLTEKVQSLPISDAGIIPNIIPGENKGGNRTCAEVAAAWGLVSNPFFCGEKIDYVNGDFVNEFPSGLEITVTEGKFVSFEMEDCILIGDKYYRVGAVIVKGSNDANVYYYPEGTLSDGGLAAPLNSSGKPAGLSNLTFCFVECEQQQSDFVIALKTYFVSGVKWASSGGVGTDDNDLHMGYNVYVFNGTNSYQLLRDFDKMLIGNIEASDYIENGIHYLEVVVDTDVDALQFSTTHLYVGTLAGFNAYYNGVTIWYANFPFIKNDITGTRIFKIPFSEITE